MSRLTPEQKAQQRTEARVGLASNVVGLTAGTAAMASGLRDERLASGGRVARGLHRAGQRIPSPIARRIDKMPAPKKAKVAAGLAVGGVALQAANLGGDVVANRVLQRSANVKKGFDMQNEQGISKAYVSPQSRTTGHGSIAKAYRRFDPEADRQRRLGTAAGVGAGAALVLGAAGGRRLAPLGRTLVQDLKTMPKGELKRVKRGALLSVGSAGAAGLGAAAYKRGVDARNRPWT